MTSEQHPSADRVSSSSTQHEAAIPTVGWITLIVICNIQMIGTWSTAVLGESSYWPSWIELLEETRLIDEIWIPRIAAIMVAARFMGGVRYRLWLSRPRAGWALSGVLVGIMVCGVHLLHRSVYGSEDIEEVLRFAAGYFLRLSAAGWISWAVMALGVVGEELLRTSLVSFAPHRIGGVVTGSVIATAMFTSWHGWMGIEGMSHIFIHYGLGGTVVLLVTRSTWCSVAFHLSLNILAGLEMALHQATNEVPW